VKEILVKGLKKNTLHARSDLDRFSYLRAMAMDVLDTPLDPFNATASKQRPALFFIGKSFLLTKFLA